jgi:cell division transport system permease protein
MLSPWLGNDKTILDDLPLPILISVELEKRTDATITKLKNTTNSLIPQAIVDAHEDWLTDLLHLTKTLRLTALAVFVLILGVTAIVISGAVRSRMAMHQRELELLHIMGATDNYICLQFVRYILAQIIKGIGFGLILGLLTAMVFFLFANQTSGMMIGLHISLYDVLVYASIPVLLIVIGIMTAYKTSYSVLHEMP